MRKASPERRDIAAEITNLIIAKIEAGTAPWSRPWTLGAAKGRPLRHNSAAYTGINTLFLWAVATEAGYQSPYWVTYKQAALFGGQVRRGEAGSLSVYFNAVSKAQTDQATGEESSRLVRFMRHYLVFNADQIADLPVAFYPTLEERPIVPSTRQAAIDDFFEPIPVDLRHGGNRAYFSPSHDFVQLPRKTAFKCQDQFASTKAHEFIHWSGGATRLARTFGKRFGDHAYAFEELVASLGQSFVAADLDLPSEIHDSHASYAEHWLAVLKRDKTAIIHAASKAEQAYRYLKQFSQTEADTLGDKERDHVDHHAL